MNKLKGFRLAAVVLTALFLGPGILQAQRQAPMTPAQPSGRTLPARPANTVRVSPVHPPPASVARARGHITTGTPVNDPGNAFAQWLWRRTIVGAATARSRARPGLQLL